MTSRVLRGLKILLNETSLCCSYGNIVKEQRWCFSIKGPSLGEKLGCDVQLRPQHQDSKSRFIACATLPIRSYKRCQTTQT